MRSAGRLLAFLFSTAGFAQTPPAWIARSNHNAQLLIDIDAKYSPEDAAAEGVKGLDEQIFSLAADQKERVRADLLKVRQELAARLTKEQDPLVKQDLEILIGTTDRDIRSTEAFEKTFLPYADVPRTIFYGVKSLLDDQIAPERRPAALVRMKKYAGMMPDYTAVVEQAEQRWREKVNTPGLLGPSKAEVEKNLENNSTYLSGIGLLLEKYRIEGYQPAYAKLKEQFTNYNDFVRKEVLPKARSDFRVPPSIYAISLEGYGVDYTPAELERMAHQSFTEIQAQMQDLAIRVAKERGFSATDYRSVIRELKKEQLTADEVLPHYQRRLAVIEDIVRKNKLVTLPARPAIIKLATAAETAQQPAPHMQPPPLMNNHGERGAFVLPLGTTGAGGAALKYDDFSFAAASWTLIAHEARPGHELQFDAMVEQGVSRCRGPCSLSTARTSRVGPLFGMVHASVYAGRR